MSTKIVHLANGVARQSKMVIKQALGSWVTDMYDRKYLDLTSGIGALSTGHSHPRVIQRVEAQLPKFVHAQQNCIYTYPDQVRLMENMSETLPNHLNSFFFTNSGSEAVENSVKLARKATGRTNIISFIGGFHGRTLGGMSLSTSKTSCRQGYQPLVPGIFHLPFPTEGSTEVGMDNLETVLTRMSHPEETAAIILEPVLGEGGVYQADVGFVQKLREVCDRHGIMWISDEVQTGMGRTGYWWGYQHFGVEPDIVCFGKGIASGFPLAVIVSSDQNFQKINSNGLGGTYNGNALATAAGVATLEVFHQDNLVSEANRKGKLYQRLLDELQHPVIESVRQYGLMIAIQLKLSPDGFSWLMSQANSHGLMILSTGISSTIRLLPPLTITTSEIHTSVKMLKKLLDSCQE
jgi:4-aminobutyrate aminotransferase-like enzyme